MPEQMKLSVGICSFSYGGNGGIKSEVPDVRDWMIDAYQAAMKDSRISRISHFDLADTPITMTRNRAVLEARKHKFDLLIMVDSDMRPDCEPDGKPFFETAFDFCYSQYPRGPVVVGVPYCGPPSHENVYVFKWATKMNNSASPDFSLAAYTREEAAIMSGVAPAAAMPTGLIMYDMRVFDLIEPVDKTSQPWFYYEWSDKYASTKGSTEDVTNTRDISLIGQKKLGYNPMHCAWDCWAGHWKPHLVRKPRIIYADHVSTKFAEAVKQGYQSDEQRIYIDSGIV